MSAVQALRRAAAPLKSCAARYLGGTASPSVPLDAVPGAAALDVRASQCIRTRTLSTEDESGLGSQTKPSADQGPAQPSPVSPQNNTPRLILHRTGDPTSAGADVSPAPYLSSANGSQKVAAKLSNVPKFVFKSDLLWFLKGCNLRPEDLLFMYDAKYRSKYVQVNFSSVESFRLAQRSLSMKGRFGGRYMKLSQEESRMDEANSALHQFRGRSLLMLNVPATAGSEDVERFFSGYALDSNFPVKYLRQKPAVPGVRRPSMASPKQEPDNQVLVRFRTESEALRAQREKQGCFCSVKAMDLRFIE